MKLIQINFKFFDNFFFLNNLNFHSNYNFFFFNKKSVYTDFLLKKNNQLINFFILNMIDVPIYFKKFKINKIKNEQFFFKFINFLMKNGKKEKMIKKIISSFIVFFNLFKWKFLLNNENNFFLFSINNFFFNFFFYSYECNFSDSQLNYNFTDNNKILNNSFFIKFFYELKFNKIFLIFSYFIKKIDKNIRKYSRGKSGKYTFTWKYIPFYKRINFLFRFLIKDVKFNFNKKFDKRILNLLYIIFFNFESTFIWKSKSFSYNFIFKKFKSSLMLNFKNII